MDCLASQRYVLIRQEIGWIEKRTIEETFEMHLFPDQLVTSSETFPLKQILDISYRKSEEDMGYLYLHTTSGVRTFIIKDDPKPFVQAFHRLTKGDAYLS
ncbi:hypothetical protein P4637_14530 [Halalkalibacterium halodurans]|jgi:hypothetical protein|uniref:BH1254 protein n=2 Tax=Halalkalibacterium halodurans TaxID=86665 RepID=Q9KDF9_HALH5|nr:hypothetical protein [Halalkalibacterium halodurans]MDY7221779.1 hypothetical protein [Halalkalibacterium halodurans]MDY7241055.1 hypothetical protein [Halalkalibacterium halodurans]MED3645397.1 hypothetical protein [Halalkalibacterium halodurans]MED4081896.1 hypothetical protein [Halalkalibacterium halodurans]MED4086022.1 hypothetical protein [Halalkalibacterium halodurans]